jgi:hypothetical protein
MKRNYGKLVAGLIVAWFTFAVTASARHLFENDAARIGLSVALAAGIPIVLFIVWFATSRGFREFTVSRDPRLLTLLHTWRIGGMTFVVLSAYGILPGIFAQPAGWGDIFIGATAPLVAFYLTSPRHKSTFIAWQVLGMIDLVMAVTLGTTARLISPNGIAMGAMTVLPLSIVPTFLVPLLLMVHIVSIAQARRWKEGVAIVGSPVRSMVA